MMIASEGETPAAAVLAASGETTTVATKPGAKATPAKKGGSGAGPLRREELEGDAYAEGGDVLVRLKGADRVFAQFDVDKSGYAEPPA